MPKYRAYLLGNTDQILRRLGFAAENDEAALRHVRDQSPQDDTEVWQGHQLIGTVPGKSR